MLREMSLDRTMLECARRRIEAAIVPAMEKIYGGSGTRIPASFHPQLKPIERVVCFYDYAACGLSVLAPLAAAGDRRAADLVRVIQMNMEYYRTHIHGRVVKGHGLWTVPLRRLIFHAALAYRALEPKLGAKERRAYRLLVEQQVEAAIEHNARFFPGERNLHLGFANNHTAIFMQGVYYCGKIFRRPEWVRLAREFAERFYTCGHPDGYWEEHTNPSCEGGPSLVYTPLTAGCLFDVLDGTHRLRRKFVEAGNFFRSFLNRDREMIPLADERTNEHGRWACYGLALHSLTPRGRTFIAQSFGAPDFPGEEPEALAVLHHELDLMHTGPGAAPEYETDGNTRIRLPLGVVRRGAWTAGLSALRALNRVRVPDSDYALDRQTLVYLAHEDAGVLLTGFKSKKDPEYSTFRIWADAYPIDTGTLRMGDGWAEAQVRYATFEATVRWDLHRRRPLLTLATGDSREVTTTLPLCEPACLRTAAPFTVVTLKGFSPYTAGNRCESAKAARFVWRKKLSIEFEAK